MLYKAKFLLCSFVGSKRLPFTNSHIRCEWKQYPVSETNSGNSSTGNVDINGDSSHVLKLDIRIHVRVGTIF